MHLLFRAPDARDARLLLRARLRDQDPRQARCTRAVARGAVATDLEAAGDRASPASPTATSRRAQALPHAACLEVLAGFRNPVLIITKNHLVARDRDVLGDLARDRAAGVMRLGHVARRRAAAPARAADLATRARGSRRFAGARDVSGRRRRTGCAGRSPASPTTRCRRSCAPRRRRGARFAGYVPLRLPYAVKELFERWLEDHFPDRKQKVLGRIRDLRGGKLNDSRFGSRLRGEGVYAEEIRALFTIACRRAGIAEGRAELSAAAFRRPGAAQLALW